MATSMGKSAIGTKIDGRLEIFPEEVILHTYIDINRCRTIIDTDNIKIYPDLEDKYFY